MASAPLSVMITGSDDVTLDEDVTEQDSRGACSGDPGRVDERFGLDRDGRVAHHPEVLRDEHRHDRHGRAQDTAERSRLPRRDTTDTTIANSSDGIA